LQRQWDSILAENLRSIDEKTRQDAIRVLEAMIEEMETFD